MKHFFTAVLMAVSCIALSGCSRQAKDLNNPEQEIPVTVMENQNAEPVTIWMETTTYPLGTKKVTVSVSNHTQSELYADEYYYIERFNGTDWNQIPLNLYFIDIAYILKPLESRDFSIGLHPDEYNYTPGRYRVSKTVNAQDQKMDLTAEFNLE